jgi:hypothetical protein
MRLANAAIDVGKPQAGLLHFATKSRTLIPDPVAEPAAPPAAALASSAAPAATELPNEPTDGRKQNKAGGAKVRKVYRVAFRIRALEMLDRANMARDAATTGTQLPEGALVSQRQVAQNLGIDHSMLSRWAKPTSR